MKLSYELLRRIMRTAPEKRLRAALPYLEATALAYGITTERRTSAWLATLAVESAEFRYQEEIASGARYEGREDLGNTEKGDGKRFKGRGRIQITGRATYQAYTNYLKRKKHLPFVDFVKEPHRLAEEPYATDAAGWFWAVYKKLNAAADRGDFLHTQIGVNGRNRDTGLPNGWVERQRYWARGLSALPDNFVLTADDQDTQTADDQDTQTPSAQSAEQAGEANAETGGGGPRLNTETIEQVVPRITKARNTLTALTSGSLLMTFSGWFAGLPPWAIFILGVLTGMFAMGLIWLVVSYHKGLFAWLGHISNINANPQMNNIRTVKA